jgi:DtxR family Mn-dependent transcriptional regulator
MEDYLEAIFDLARDRKVVRVRDIARQLGVKMPTVTSMLKTLRDRNLVVYEKYEYVELTREGQDVGREIDRRHQVLGKFLTEVLKVPPVQADQEACRMEHAFSQETLDTLVDFMEFIQSCPRTGKSWLAKFDEFRMHGRRPERCREAAPGFSEEFTGKMKRIAKGRDARGGPRQVPSDRQEKTP